MKRYIVLIPVLAGLTIFMPSLFSSNPTNTNNPWAETMATICVKSLKDGNFDYVIVYDAPESIATNSKGEKILGPIEQWGLTPQEPINYQKVRLKYLKEEPIIFELIEPLKLKK